MDAVNAFNMELFSMIDMKPPISRAKMMSVTKSAIKAIKLYKHVVQIVEKFIKKCKPELKVPGLYVVDSIVRQSRHQFGIDKDVFAARFLKNFTDTFQNLYGCPEDDKSKIIRVLNLWQKNGVFDMDIIQPLMDMANGTIVPAPALEVTAQPETQLPVTSATVIPAVAKVPSPDALAAVAQLFQSPHGQELQRMLQNFQQADKNLTTIANNIPNPPQVPVAQLTPYSPHTEKKSSLAEKLLDRFDYDDEPEDMMAKEGSAQSQGIPENVFNQHPGQMSNAENVHPHMTGQTVGMEHGEGMSHGEHHMMLDGYHSLNEAYSHSRGNSREDSSMRREGRHRGYSRRSRSRSGSRSPRRKRSRSSSCSKRSRHRRSRSREQRRRSRSGSHDKIEREKDRERRQKGLPSIKSQTLSVCSTTLWVGQLDKKTQQSDVMSLLEEFGQIESINMIPPRGCAYIVMVHRQDANTALNKLSRGSYKVNQKPVKIAWALNKGIKSAHKKFWDVERGVTYIPWSKVKVEELESYREGGILDADTLNPEWNHSKDLNKQAAVNGALESVPADGTVTAHIQVPLVQQAVPIRSPAAFPGPIMLSPTSMPPGGAPFLPTEFGPTKLAPGSIKHPEESRKDSKGDKGTPSDPVRDNHLGSPGAPVITMPGPGVLQGPRPGMPPLQPPPGMPNPHLAPFLSPPNMPHMPLQMMPRGPMFPPDRFRMPMPFPPRGPPFHRHPSMGPEGMDGREGRHFRNGRPGFGCPPFHRGRW
ncbi:SR-related and CTD-associated factor 4-like isoform X2 [Etheostoma cragini]|uniref:SR-related and CTD-associated factor 4-like isoform X2 n=1 Tax=Etheostoma cragini TaxID=417921 RepID=UPI00155E4024|nr:SR-related and CTD-associated factor 4-like isoform X2 [Etheostoma cragini]